MDFWSGYSETNAHVNCPCNNGRYPPTSFVGNNYYCESGSEGLPSADTYYFNDALWDGAGCTGGTCCDDTTQPWFYHQLNKTTQDDIEARICAYGPFSIRSALIDQLELYVYIQ